MNQSLALKQNVCYMVRSFRIVAVAKQVPSCLIIHTSCTYIHAYIHNLYFSTVNISSDKTPYT